MSLLQSALRETLPRTPERLDQPASLIDPVWIEHALHLTGKSFIRRRKLPAEHAIWLVIGLALFRNLPVGQVMQQLDLNFEGNVLPAPSMGLCPGLRFAPYVRWTPLPINCLMPAWAAWIAVN